MRLSGTVRSARLADRRKLTSPFSAFAALDTHWPPLTPKIDFIRLRSVNSLGEPPLLSSHFVKSLSATSCSTETFETPTFTLLRS